MWHLPDIEDVKRLLHRDFSLKCRGRGLARSHALMTLIVGGRVTSILIQPDTSGLTLSLIPVGRLARGSWPRPGISARRS